MVQLVKHDVRIVQCKGDTLILKLDADVVAELENKQSRLACLYFEDKRSISHQQRKAIFATIKDIARYSGHEPEYLRSFLMWDYCYLYDVHPFSLSNSSCDVANGFINYLIEFCISYDVPVSERLLGRTEDVVTYVYLHLKYKKCVICGKPAEFHHCTGSRVGMGRDRTELPLVGCWCYPLCREHHTEIHANAERVFHEKYQIQPIRMQKELMDKYQ